MLHGCRHAAVGVWKDFSRHDGPQAAAAFSFYAFLSLFALLVLAAGVLGLIFRGRPDLSQRAVEYLVRNAPGLSGILEEALKTSADHGGLLSLVGFISLLLSGTKVADSFQVWLNRIWGKEKPAILKRKLKSVVILLVLGTSVALGLALHAVLVYVASRTDGLEALLSGLSTLGAVALQGAGLTLAYSYAVEKGPGIGGSWKGAFLAALLINPLLLFLAWYYANMGDLAAVYGSFAGVVMGILTIYYAAYVVFLGAELNLFLHTGKRKREPQSFCAGQGS